jgi:flagellar biosynthesis/type III secretory pathway chaperone
MNGQTTVLSRNVKDMLDVLERDTQHIERTLSFLNELRGLVIKRDEQNLGRLLEEIRTETQEYSANEHRRRMAREQLAGLFGCKTGELTLSVLRTRIDEPEKSAIAESQKKLRALTERLQREYISTAALLSDCARINSRLLKIVFEQSRAGPVCYNSQGTTARGADAAFMNMRL